MQTRTHALLFHVLSVQKPRCGWPWRLMHSPDEEQKSRWATGPSSAQQLEKMPAWLMPSLLQGTYVSLLAMSPLGA